MSTKTTKARIGPNKPIRGGAKVGAGSVIASRELVTIAGEPVAVPDKDRLVHLQLRRFAGCPICNLHLHSMARRHDEIVAAGIREVVVFHSTAEELLRTGGRDLPFAVIPDPEKRLYGEFGVERSSRSLLDRRSWRGIRRGVLHALWGYARRERRPPRTMPTGGRLGLPADLLIASDGRVLACKYGVHADDQWSADQLLGIAASTRAEHQ